MARGFRGKLFLNALEYNQALMLQQMLSNVPSYLPEEFIAAYPEAKFILTERDPDAWLSSLRRTTGPFAQKLGSWPISFLRYFDPFLFHVSVSR